jgi:uncharacterized protein YqhQ
MSAKKLDLKAMSNDDLLELEKKGKSNINVLTVAILGMSLVAVLNAISGGQIIFTLLPIIFLPILLKSRTNSKTIQEEIKSRSF